jgi:hypothetical protein
MAVEDHLKGAGVAVVDEGHEVLVGELAKI